MHVPLPFEAGFFYPFFEAVNIVKGRRCAGFFPNGRFCHVAAQFVSFCFCRQKVFAFRLQGKKVRETLLYAKPAYGRAKPLHATWKMTFEP